MSLSPGTRLGSYEIVAPVGAGGMGEVYRARDTNLNRDVALKVLLDAVVGDVDRMARFKREAHVLASLNHPSIAHLYGFEVAGGGKGVGSHSSRGAGHEKVATAAHPSATGWTWLCSRCR
jgi:serine/threonine protein kinase